VPGGTWILIHLVCHKTIDSSGLFTTLKNLATDETGFSIANIATTLMRSGL
jgi:hypothetical protein